MPQDYFEAFKWSRMAAERGNSEAQFLVAGCYGLGHAVPEDLEEAYAWASVAAAQGHKNGIKFRDLVSTKLGPEAFERARNRARKIQMEIKKR